ncbi:RNA polymerase sigma factor [Opitutaceae bacterium TAV4]|nr:RNA polymerase sigma factor [Opitutaceae bacterium TAV4]RRJ98893.1 RNA polymerase sigma factor [Opitutaceae bacterium TAV3]
MADDAPQLNPPPAPPAPALSLEALFLAEESRLLRFATHLTGDFALAQDLVQDAFLRLHRQLHQHHDTITQPRAWLFRTLRNLAHNHRRKHARVTPLDPTAHEQLADPAPQSTPPGDRLAHHESLLLMRLCLDDLPPRDRELIHLKFDHELTYDEIARRTGLGIGNIGYLLHHALKRLTAAFHRASSSTDQPAP